jgi:hypothetical protein
MTDAGEEFSRNAGATAQVRTLSPTRGRVAARPSSSAPADDRRRVVGLERRRVAPRGLPLEEALLVGSVEREAKRRRAP